ncbi:hypothetical protein K474DRAFT_1631397 [Panus rudis PR-1116 ss-1]|nr:hypothetical protein K474DRAFT_1631397 [Panus rudis PR-1116 ss-1]
MICPLVFGCLLATSGFARVLQEVPSQAVLTVEGEETESLAYETAPVLRRYNIQFWTEEDKAALLQQTENAGADVWQLTPAHADIFLNGSHDQQLDELLIPPASYTDSLLPHTLLGVNQHQPPSNQWNFSSLDNSTFHTIYHPLQEVEDFIQELYRQYPDLVTPVNIGHSAEGREMYALQITKSKQVKRQHASQHDNARKIGFVLMGAQHAREWIATSTAMYLAHALVAEVSEPYSLRKLLDSFDFHIIIEPNPDGYLYTWESDRFWYKNRQVVGPNAKCVGIDMNRNWGYKWKPKSEFGEYFDDSFKRNKKPRVPTDPCSHWYPGHRAFEAPEVNNIANYITTQPNLQAFVELRSYGQMLSSPYSYSCKRIPKDAEDQVEAAMGAAKAVKEVHGTTFKTGRLCENLYKAPGNIVDYMFARAGIKYSYAAHLRDTGTYGFSLPPEWIRPVGEETVALIRSLAAFMTGRKV